MREEEKNNTLTHAVSDFDYSSWLHLQEEKHSMQSKAKQSKVSRAKLKTRGLINTSEVLIIDNPLQSKKFKLKWQSTGTSRGLFEPETAPS